MTTKKDFLPFVFKKKVHLYVYQKQKKQWQTSREEEGIFQGTGDVLFLNLSADYKTGFHL